MAKSLTIEQRQARAYERSVSLMEYDAAIRRETGSRLLAGVDEVGRGAMAGPLVAAAVILPPRYLVPGIDDSKVLTPQARFICAQRVARAAICWAVAFVDAKFIDRNGLTAANMTAMEAAIEGLKIKPDLVLSDGYPIQHCSRPNRGVVHGDRLSQVIAAAACLAKVVRDAWMSTLGEEYFPGYGWERNAGYATAEHRYCIQNLGPTSEHRLLFLRELLGTNPIHHVVIQPGLPLVVGE